jgi:hypothetical protein
MFIGKNRPAGAFFHKGNFSPKDKEYFQTLCRAFAVAHEATICMVVSEMWVSAPTLNREQFEKLRAAPDQEEAVRKLFGMPSEDPERIEVLGMWLQTDEGHRFTSRKIIRHDNGKFFDIGPSDLKDMVESNGDTVVGEFRELLPPIAPNKEQVQSAINFLKLHGVTMAGTVPDPK